MKKDERLFAIYSRKSKFTGKGESIGNQIELCKEYLQNHYVDVSEERIAIFEDEGFSGKNMARPALKRLMKEVENKKIKSIIVYRLDRISRNINDFSGMIDKLSYLNVDFISIREQFDTSTPMGRAMMYIASVFSQLERETTAERIRDNMHELAKTGRWLGGTTPTGYTSENVETITIDGKVRRACKLKEIPEEVEIIKTIFSLYKKTDSQTMTEKELIKMGIRTKNGKYFSRYSIKGILQNPVYMIADEDAYNYLMEEQANLFSEKEKFDGIHGIMAYNRTNQNGKTIIYKSIDNWIVSVGKHKGLIRGKDWVAVQYSLRRNKSKSYRKPRTNEAILTGLIFCKCGEKMYPKVTQRLTADGVNIYTYVCKLKERSQGSVCKSKSINGNTLDIAVIEQLKQLNEKDNVFLKRLNEMKKFYLNNDDDSYNKQLDVLKKEKYKLEKKAVSLVDSLVGISYGYAKTKILDELDKVGKELNNLEFRMKELNELNKNQESNMLEFDLFVHLLSSLVNSFEDMTIEEKRAAVRSIIKKVVWDGTHVHIYLFGESTDDNMHLCEDGE